MNYLHKIICESIKRCFDIENAVGVSLIVDVPEIQEFIDEVSRIFTNGDGYLVIDGIKPCEYNCPSNLHLAGNVEKAVEWRSTKEAQGKIIFNCKKIPKRSHSLEDFYKLTQRSIVKSIAHHQYSSAENEPLKRFWSAIESGIEESVNFSLNNILDFIDATNGKTTGFEKELWKLGLIPDLKILAPNVNVMDRIVQNHEVIEKLTGMDDSIRNRISASLANYDKDEKKAYKILLSYFRKNDLSILKSLDLDQVVKLISKTKAKDKTPQNNKDGDENFEDIQKKPQNPNKIILDDYINGLSGDEEAKTRMNDLGDAVFEYTENHDPFDDNASEEQPSVEDPKTGIVQHLPLAKLDKNLYKLIMMSCSTDNWGGVVVSKYSNLHDAIADADAICSEPDAFKSFNPCNDVPNPFFAKNTGLRKEFLSFEQALSNVQKHSNLVDLFDKIVEIRTQVIPYLDVLIRYGHLPALGCNPNAVKKVREYVNAWKNLFDELRRVEGDIHELSDKEYQHAARCLLSLDVLFFWVKGEWKAIMLPANPLFLWMYSEIYGQLENSEYDFKKDEFKKPFLKTLEDLPNLINFQLVPREIYSLVDCGANDDYILPCSGAHGILPTFENKTNRYLGSDGIECIEDTIDRYLSFAPYAGNDLRICAVDVPDIVECVRIIVKIMLEKNTKGKNSIATTLEIYLTENHSGGREVDDLDFVKQDSNISELIQTDALRIKVTKCKNVVEIINALEKDPVHLAFFFDQSTYQVSYGNNTRELYITPLVVTYDFRYDVIAHDGEIFPNTDTNNGFLGSYYGILDKTGSACSQSKIPRTSYLKTEELEHILNVIDKHYAQWMIVADRVVYNYVPKNGLPIGVKNFGKRNVCIWTNKNSRVIYQFMVLLKQYNLHPSADSLVEVFNRFGHISGEGLVGIPAKQPGDNEVANSRKKGMLGTVFAAKWYSDRYPGSLIASLDSNEGRTWLNTTSDETSGNNRADLVGFRFDSENDGIFIDVIEVKTRSIENKDFSISVVNGQRVIKGHAADQITYVLKRLKQIFQFDAADSSNMFVAARRETLKYQIVNECFRSRYLDGNQVYEWSKRLKKAFSGNSPVTVSGTILHIDLENNACCVSDDKGVYGDESKFEIQVISLTAARIQHEIFGDIAGAFRTNCCSELCGIESKLKDEKNINKKQESSKTSTNAYESFSNDAKDTDCSLKKSDLAEGLLLENSFHNEEKITNIKDDFESLSIDTIIGGTSKEISQKGLIGIQKFGNKKIALDLEKTTAISLFGVQGAGKSYTIGTVTEMVLKQIENVNQLPSPLAGVIFHYSESIDYAPEFTSMIRPNDKETEVAALLEFYNAHPDSIQDIVLLAPKDKVEERRVQYPNIEIQSIEFSSKELDVASWLFLLGAVGNEALYIKQVKQIMKSIRNNLTLENIRKEIQKSSIRDDYRPLIENRLNLAKEYINDDISLKNILRPGRLVIVDLRDEFIEKDDALKLFVVMLNIFSSVKEVQGKHFNKFIVFDEAHKYMDNKELSSTIATTIKEMRHKGVSIMIASQDPTGLPSEIIELSSILIMHRFNSPAWLKHIQKAITQTSELTPGDLAGLKTGEAFIWANESSDPQFSTKPIKVKTRPRVTKHGGATISAIGENNPVAPA